LLFYENFNNIGEEKDDKIILKKNFSPGFIFVYQFLYIVIFR